MPDNAPEPCHACGSPAVRALGTRAYCGGHLAALYSTFDPAVFALAGLGLQHGLRRPEYSPLHADLECNACGAGWVGVPGDPCWWCRRAHALMIDHQARLALRPPDVDRDNQRAYNTAMTAWAARLANGVASGLVDKAAADRAWRREVKRGQPARP